MRVLVPVLLSILATVAVGKADVASRSAIRAADGYDHDDDDDDHYKKKKKSDAYGEDDEDDDYDDDDDDYYYTKKPTKYSYKSYDGYPDSMKTSNYRPSDGYVSESVHFEVPNPTISFESDPNLRLPKLDQYHCFLNGAPWTNCGGKPLREFFLDQCLAIYFEMTASVDGLCAGKPHTSPATTKKPVPTDDDYGDDDDEDDEDDYYGRVALKEDYGSYKTKKPKTTTKAPYTAPPRAPTYCDNYFEERCLQSNYVSITTATVQCLTENAIRIIFIEKYAAEASGNPIEGPALYLKKLHEFISNVIDCNANQIKNYPSIWRKFTSQLGVAYNPTAPYIVRSDNRIELPRCTSPDASGWKNIEFNKRFYCDPRTLQNYGNPNWTVFASDPTDRFYQPATVGKCPSVAAAYTTLTPLYKICQVKTAFNPTIDDSLSEFGLGVQFLNPNTLRGLLDSVRTIDDVPRSASRPVSIAEIFAHHHGTVRQPILEGNGILYYCGFYACRANNNGDTSACFPPVTRKDWSLPHWELDSWNALTDDIQECLNEKWIDGDDVTEISRDLTDALRARSHICITEKESATFYEKLNGPFNPKVEDGHWLYLRQLANERCFISGNVGKDCQTTEDYYEQTFAVLRKIKNRCVSQMAEAQNKPTTTIKPKKKKSKKGYGYDDDNDDYDVDDGYGNTKKPKKTDDDGYIVFA